MKIASTQAQSFFIEQSATQKRHFLKSKDFTISQFADHLTLFNAKGDVILKEIAFNELLDNEDNTFASIDDAANYVKRVIDPESGGDISPSAAIFDRVANGAEENIAVAVGSVGTPVTYSYTAPANKEAIITRVQLWLEEQTATFTVDGFASAASLANGVLIRIGGEDFGLIQTNRDIATLFEVARTSFLTQTNRSLEAVTNIRSGLILGRGQSFEVIVQDDLNALIGGAGRFYVRLQGNLIN